MSGNVFVDTNVLVYSRDSRDTTKQRRAQQWIEFLWETKRGRLSRQVLQEYFVTVTRKLKPGMPVADARSDVRALFHWLQPVDAPDLIEAAWSLQDRGSLSFWDALVVGAADCMDCAFLLSEDLGAGQVFGAVRVVDPFETDPGALPA